MAKLHMDTLAKKAKRSKRAVRDAVNELPKELDDTYREAIRRIKGQDEDDVALAEQVLAWVCLCYEQVNVPQLQQALATQQGYSYDDQESLIDPDDFISVCAGLVAVDKERQVVRLVHYTAESFFERELLHHFPRARSQISLTCIAHLLDMRINSMAWDNTSSYSPFLERYYYHEIEQGIESAKEKGFGYNTFARYAINYAIQHIQANPDSALLESTQRFWRSENIVDIRKAYTYLHRKAGKICLLDCYPVLTELQLVVFFGFSSEINRLVAAGVVSDKGSVGTAVCIAADRGNSSILNLLLASGAPADGCIEMYPEEFWTALECAVDQTHLATVQILLQNLEITSTLPGNKLQTALHLAAKSLWPTGVKILLEHGAEANSTTFERQTPLHWAMMKYTPQNQGNLIEVIHLLLGAGTDVNARDVYGKSPLSYIQGTDIKVSRFLRGRGAIDMPDSQIIQNIRMGIIPKVRELLSMGVDVNTLCYEFGFPTGMNALQVTLVESPEPKLIQILLEAGANPDQHGPDGNALYIAVKLRRDPYRIIKPILDKIRNIDATFNDETALYLAAEHGFVHTVQVLLDGGASPEVDCGKYGSALAVTSRNFHSPVTKLLLQWGATVDRRVIKALNELRTDYYASWEQHISYSPYANIFDLLRQHASVEYSAKLQQLWEDVSNYLPARMINESSRFNY
jgi:ankyrin repeat protein